MSASCYQLLSVCAGHSSTTPTAHTHIHHRLALSVVGPVVCQSLACLYVGPADCNEFPRFPRRVHNRHRYNFSLGSVHASCFLRVYTSDGTVEVSTSGCEIGQGLYTKVAQAVAYKCVRDSSSVHARSAFRGVNCECLGGENSAVHCMGHQGTGLACMCVCDLRDVM